MKIRPTARPAPRTNIMVRARPRAPSPATVTPSPPPAPPAPAPAPAATAPRADYTVGKNKPPVHTRWQKGQSGNPRGKKRGTPNTDTLVVELMDGLVPVKTSGGERKMARQAALLQRMWELAAKGNLRAAQFLFDRYAQAQARQANQQADTEPLAPEERAILERHLAALGFDDGEEVP